MRQHTSKHLIESELDKIADRIAVSQLVQFNSGTR